MKPEVGHWLYASCSASDYGQIVAVGEDDNGAPTIDIRLSDPQDLVTCDGNGTNGWSEPLTTLEVAGDLILRNVQWRPGTGDDGFIICNTPGSECFRCTKLFQLRTEKATMKWENESCQASSGFIRQEIRDLIARGGVTLDEWKALRMNSYEREALVPALGDKALCHHVESYLAQCGRTRSPPSTYEEAVVGLLAPELVKRLREKSLFAAAKEAERVAADCWAGFDIEKDRR